MPRPWSLLPVLLTIASAAAAAPAACPADHVRVVHSNGPPTDYLGVYPGLPELCFQRRGNDPGYYYYGTWKTDWPGAGEAYPAVKTVLDSPKGTRTSFITRALPGWQWVDSFTNEGIETMDVGGKTYRVLRLAHEREGFDGNTYHSIITSWRDVATGINLKTVEQQISGQSYGPDTTWHAVAVERLP